MADKKKSQTGKVVPFKTAKATRASEQKWGKQVMSHGFCIIPSLILRAQQRLGLDPTQLAILLQIADFWWDEARKPWPSKDTLSARLGLSPRQIQRRIAELEQAGLIKRIERRAVHRGKLSNAYDLSGLVKKLAEIEPDFRAVSDETEALKKDVVKPGFRHRRKKAPE